MTASGFLTYHLAYEIVSKMHGLHVFDPPTMGKIYTLLSGFCRHCVVCLRCHLQQEMCQSLCSHRALYLIVLKLTAHLHCTCVFTCLSFWWDGILRGQGYCLLMPLSSVPVIAPNRFSESIYWIPLRIKWKKFSLAYSSKHKNPNFH